MRANRQLSSSSTRKKKTAFVLPRSEPSKGKGLVESITDESKQDAFHSSSISSCRNRFGPTRCIHPGIAEHGGHRPTLPHAP